MIAERPFGNTGYMSTRTIFGAAALSAMKQDRADQVLETLLEFGVNHIDVAASYGEAELRVGEWMKEHRDKFFLATKTGERTASGARESIHRSLDRLKVSRIDLIQFHNLTDEPGWAEAMGPGGALEAAVEARDQGLVRFIGVTGHGTLAARMHFRSLNRFNFDSVLLPYNYPLMRSPEYAADFNRLLEVCLSRGVAVQTIKAVARRRWRPDDTRKRYSWYEPVKDPEALRQVVHWVLHNPQVFLNTSSDATILPLILQAAAEFQDSAAIENSIQEISSRLEMEPIFIRGVMDGV